LNKLKKLIAAVAILPLIFLAASGCVENPSDTRYEKTRTVVFGGIMPFEFWGLGKNADKALNEMLLFFEKLEALTNINREGPSDILNINLADAGKEVEIDFITFDIIAQAKRYYEETDGACNIAAYPLSYLWGIDSYGYNNYRDGLYYEDWTVPPSFANSDIDRKLPLPDHDEVLRVKEFCDLDKLTVFEKEGKYYAKKEIAELMIDLGGISKGYAADQCAKICERNGIKSAKIDLSGNLYFVGLYENKADWNVGIWNPYGPGIFDPHSTDNYFCATAAGADISLVTSGDYQRYRYADKEGGDLVVITHIIDTKTGLPYTLTYNEGRYENIAGSVVSCTVINGNSAFADAYAKTACVMGIETARAFFEANGVKAIMFTSDKRAAFTFDAEPVLTEVYDVYKNYTYSECSMLNAQCSMKDKF